MIITERRLRKVIRNVMAEMLGTYKRPKSEKGFKWGKWSRSYGNGGSMANYYDDDYADGVDEIDEAEVEIDEEDKD